MAFFKKLFSKIKNLPKTLKGMSLKGIVLYFKTHRLLGILYLFLIIAIITIAIVLVNHFLNQQTDIAISKTDESSTTADVRDLSLTIPENAFPYPKSFTINKLPRDSAYDNYKRLGSFYGDIYELNPTDGRNDLALEPITYTYKIPQEFYFGDEYYNFELLYIEDKENPVIKVFSGGEIIQNDNKQPILRTKGFHGSLVGLRVNNPVKQALGLKKIIEKPDTLKPELLLIPGIDINFQGFLPNTISNNNPQGNNLWEVTFEDRSIWIYDYPLTETRSANYVREAQNFFSDISKTSYIRFEAEKLANTLNQSNQEYDIIAHGIGGIIARYAIENYPITNIRKMVLISVPNAGTNIVNPSFLNLLYGKDSQVLSQIYGLDADTIRYLTRNNLGYLENVNVFYTDILPFAEVIKTLETSIRDDISYLFIGGSRPDFDADLADSQFAKFYPENTSEKGDGVVSVYSAIYPTLEEVQNKKGNLLSKIVPYSFFDIFLQQETLNLIHSYLEEGIEVVSVPEYQDDTFREWLFNNDSTMTNTEDASLSNIFVNSTITDTTTETITFPKNHQQITNSTQTDNDDSFEDWKKEDYEERNVNNHFSDDSYQNTKNATLTETHESNIEKTFDIIESLNKQAQNELSSENKKDPDYTPKMKLFTPDSENWNTNLFPESFLNIQNLILYNLTRHKFPFDTSPYGMKSVGDAVFLFDNTGLIMFKNGNFRRISDQPVNAYFADTSTLYIVQNNILTEYSNGDPVKMSYLMFEAPILSLAVTDSQRYYLLSQNGLTFETPSQSFNIDGHYGQILLYGIYPYIITDAGVYLFNGEKCELIYKPYNSEIQLKNGIIYNDSLYLLASDYSLRTISLDGQKILMDTVHNIGGIKLLKDSYKLIVAGRNKFNIINYSYKKPEGTFFEFPHTIKIIDAIIHEGNLLVLVKEGDSIFIKKIGIME